MYAVILMVTVSSLKKYQERLHKNTLYRLKLNVTYQYYFLVVEFQTASYRINLFKSIYKS